MSESENEESGGETRQYRVEVGLTRTGMATVEAESEEAAREEAKEQMTKGRVHSEIAEVFTNNVRGGGD